MLHRLMLSILLAAAALPTHAQDTTAGRSAFVMCAGCHSIDGTNLPAGPTLKGVFGRKAAALPGFAYSPALRASGLRWNAETLEAYLAAPASAVPGTTKLLAVSDPAQRRQLIAYLRTLK